jgi:NAD(P)-dependent dehydrogenase (short-subunit alcohol dehydrogenase family)
MTADESSSARVALVTGAARGIGQGIALELGRHGWRVAVNDYRAEGVAEDTAAQVRALGPEACAIDANVGVAADVARLVDEVVERFGRVDLLVNNAGVQTTGALLDVTEADWDRVIDTNLKGCFLCTQAVARRMKDTGGGAIVNIGSGCCKVPFPGLVAYSASKAGIDMLTKLAAVELGPLGIRVNCVAPGAVEVERTRLEREDYAGEWSRVTPLRRIGTPLDIARAVAFLASDEASFITGQTIWVDGGLFGQPPWAQE